LGLKRCSIPSDTATSDAFLFQPVAKALDARDGKIPTSGIPMLASRASSATVSTSHCSWRVCGWVMIRVPVLRLAIHLDRNRETKDLAKPQTAQKSSNEGRFNPS